jgi:hypothetical protein
MIVPTTTGTRMVHCLRCGAVLGEREMQAEHVLVDAACCPRCDGPLARTVKRAGPDTEARQCDAKHAGGTAARRKRLNIEE